MGYSFADDFKESVSGDRLKPSFLPRAQQEIDTFLQEVADQGVTMSWEWRPLCKPPNTKDRIIHGPGQEAYGRTLFVEFFHYKNEVKSSPLSSRAGEMTFFMSQAVELEAGNRTVHPVQLHPDCLSSEWLHSLDKQPAEKYPFSFRGINAERFEEIAKRENNYVISYSITGAPFTLHEGYLGDDFKREFGNFVINGVRLNMIQHLEGPALQARQDAGRRAQRELNKAREGRDVTFNFGVSEPLVAGEFTPAQH